LRPCKISNEQILTLSRPAGRICPTYKLYKSAGMPGSHFSSMLPCTVNYQIKLIWS
jgi:hypothetical protein